MRDLALLSAVLVVVAIGLPAVVAAQAWSAAEARDSTRASLVRDVSYLASRSLAGRATGSAGSDSAAEYLAKRYVAMQINPGAKTTPCDASSACRYSYFQAFRPPLVSLVAAQIDTSARAYNVVAVVSGTDTLQAQEWIVVGAHYDHLGQTGIGARDPQFASVPHVGADDNASGTAAVLELARRLAASPLRRSVMFVHFAAEEIGVVGSRTFLLDPPVPLGAMVAMVNLDMVGRLGRGRLQIFGVESAPEWGRIIDDAHETERLPLVKHDPLGLRGTASDHVPFFDEGIPVVHLFTGLHDEYHTKDDTVDRIDFDGLTRIVAFAERLVRLVGDGAAVPTRSVRRQR
jgi:hypothetical protein